MWESLHGFLQPEGENKRAKPLENRGNESADHKIIILDYMKTASLYILEKELPMNNIVTLNRISSCFLH